MNLDLVARLVRDARHLPPGPHLAGRALALVPALVDALPGVRLPADGRTPTFPVACSDLLSDPVDRALRTALDDVRSGARVPTVTELTAALRDDPLARGLQRLLLEGASLSAGAACLVALDYARLCAAALSAPGPLLREGVNAVNTLPVGQRGAALGGVAAAMQARLALAITELASDGLRPPALLSTIAANPLVFLFVHGGFPQGMDVSFLAGVTGAPIPEAMAQDAGICFDTAVRETLDRLQARKGTPADHSFALRFNLAELRAGGGNPAAVLRAEPDAWAHLLPQLASVVATGSLAKAGADRARAAELCRPDVAVAVAATLRGSLRALQVWDVLAGVTACLAPTGEDSIERQLLVPRGSETVATIVAVSTGMLRTAAAEPVALSREVGEAVSNWRDSLGSSAVVSDDGSVALFAFSDAARGLAFALSLRERPAVGLPVPAVSMATGPVGGGTDGATVRLSGPAVQDALRLLCHAPLDMRPSGAPALSQVSLIEGTLRGDGVVAHSSALEALRARRPKQLPGERPAWAQEAWDDELGVLALIPVNGLADACELARCTAADWEAVCAGGNPQLAAKPAAAPPPAVVMPESAGKVPNPASHEVRRPRREPAPTVAAPPDPTHVPDPPVRAALPEEPAPAQENPFAGSTPVVAVSDPFAASDPFAGAAAGAPAGGGFAPLLGDPFATAHPTSAPASEPPGAPSGDLGDIFGVPVGDTAAPPPKAPPPAIGAFGLIVEDAAQSPPPQDEVPNDGFSLPVYASGTGGEGPALSAPGPAPRKAKKAPMVDFTQLLRSYACYVDGGRVTFGRPYGTRIVDLHAYETEGDLDAAYQSFVEAKIREGFIPQTELAGELPRTVTVMPLDHDRLAQAWRALT